ncbi:SDR family oxidoreductase [Serratia nevei]|uniref:SDR family NAD(P)-dependent oxidoreductase n=1 Tax=Serratia nevei TaxID=2703794 RepID=UPI00209DEF3D|nr:SDR family oxidoreductase [Serratia nevei]MCP1106280.1 SDR family oxidoreductase [Serratia nevei]
MQKIAVITGASSGIGAVYADRLANMGYDLILVARRRDRLQALAERITRQHSRRVEVFPADLADERDLAAVAALFSEQPAIRFLVNCAGSGALGPTTAVGSQEMDSMLRVNVLALTRLSRAAAQRFAQERQGTIVNIGSVMAMMPANGAGAYSGSKAYVLNFSRALRHELAGFGVNVQVVMPGPVRSEFFGEKPAPFPETLFMTPETLVDSALKALEQGEWVCFPTLQDNEVWQRFDAVRGELAQALIQTGRPADRYA